MVAPIKSRATTRAKSTGLTNRIDFECAVDRVSYIQVELRTLKAERDAAVQLAQQKHAEAIGELEDELKAKLALCEKFAAEHRADLLPGKAKSAETPVSQWGFRMGMPQLKTLSKWTWDKVLDAIRGAKLTNFIRTKEEVAKDAILALAQDNPAFAAEVMSKIGVRVVQDETFFVVAKVDGEKGGA